MSDKYLLICNNCGNRHYTDGTTKVGFVEIKTAPLPARANGKKEIKELPRKYRCTKCGYTFKIVKLKEDEKKEENKTKYLDTPFKEDIP